MDSIFELIVRPYFENKQDFVFEKDENLNYSIS